MERVDIAIIGSGPAAVSAAITATVREKSILMFGSKDLSAKVSKAHQIRNYPGLPEISGAELASKLQDHLNSMGIEIREEHVSNIYAMGDFFGIQTGAGMYEASTIILATGAALGKPLPGEDKFLGNGVSYCATCDAFFYRDKTVAVIGDNKEAVHEAEFLAQTCKEVLYLPGKKSGPATFSADNVQVISGRAQSIDGADKVEAFTTSEDSFPVDGVFILKEAISPEKLVPGLAMDGNHVQINLDMATNIPGCFACGDIAGKPYQYIKAAGQGNIAALSAVDYLAQHA